MQIFIERNGFKTEVTKNQLFALAADGSIGPETKLYLDGKEVLAGRVKGLTFKNREDDIYNIPDDPPAGATPFPNQVPVNSVPQNRTQAADFQKFFPEKKPRKFSALRVVIIAICLFAMIGSVSFYVIRTQQRKEWPEQNEVLKKKLDNITNSVGFYKDSIIRDEDVIKEHDKVIKEYEGKIQSFADNKNQTEISDDLKESIIEFKEQQSVFKKERENRLKEDQQSLKTAEEDLKETELKLQKHKEIHSVIFSKSSSVASLVIFIISLLSFLGQFFVKSL